MLPTEGAGGTARHMGALGRRIGWLWRTYATVDGGQRRVPEIPETAVLELRSTNELEHDLRLCEHLIIGPDRLV